MLETGVLIRWSSCDWQISRYVIDRAMSFRAWMVETYIWVLQYLGRAPKDMNKLTSKLKTLHEMDAIKAQQPNQGMVSFSW